MYLRWGDSKLLTGGGLTLTSGAMASTFQLNMAPPAAGRPETDADLLLGDGDDADVQTKWGNRLLFADCRVADGTVHRDPHTHICNFMVRDFRWKWGLAPLITGEYNRRDDSGKIVGARKSARELAWLLYDRLPCPAGKDAADIKALPDDEYPAVDWREYTRPAEALADICDLYGVLICPAIGTRASDGAKVVGRMQLYKQGAGAAKPALNRSAAALPLYTPDIPDNLLFVGGWTIEQRAVALEAVCYDPADDDYKSASDLTLSYHPGDDGWYIGAELETTDDELRKAAGDTLWRFYRIPETVILGKEELTRKEAARRMLNHRVDKVVVDGQDKYLDAFVTGAHGTEDSNTDPYLYRTDITARVEVGFNIDTEHGVVIFDRPVFAINGGLVEGASLQLTCAWKVEPFIRQFEIRNGLVGCWEIVRNPAIFYEYTVDAAGVRTLQNEVEINAAAYAAARSFATQWQMPPAQESNTYPGVQPLMPDGQLEQITWALDANTPPTTRGSWGAEHDAFTLRRALRKKAARLKGAVRGARGALGGAGSMFTDPAGVDPELATTRYIDLGA